jgi:hypothetical protein
MVVVPERVSSKRAGAASGVKPSTPGKYPATSTMRCVAALLNKVGLQKVPLDIRYVGFEIPSEFVVGYGLDYNERYRNLPYVATLKPEAYGGVPE